MGQEGKGAHQVRVYTGLALQAPEMAGQRSDPNGVRERFDLGFGRHAIEVDLSLANDLTKKVDKRASRRMTTRLLERCFRCQRRDTYVMNCDMEDLSPQGIASRDRAKGKEVIHPL